MFFDQEWCAHLDRVYGVKTSEGPAAFQYYYKVGFLVKLSGFPAIGTHTPFLVESTSKDFKLMVDSFLRKRILPNEIMSINLKGNLINGLDDLACAKRLKIITKQRRTSIVELTSYDNFWVNMKSRARNEYRKAEKNFLYTKDIKLTSYLDDISAIIEATASRKKFTNSFDYEALNSLIEYLGPNQNKGFCIGTFHENDLVSFAIFLI